MFAAQTSGRSGPRTAPGPDSSRSTRHRGDMPNPRRRDEIPAVTVPPLGAVVAARGARLTWPRRGHGGASPGCSPVAPSVRPSPSLLVLGPNKNAPEERISNVPAQQPERQVKAPLPQEARNVAMRFIQTAVARKNLDEAWTLVGPNLRGGLTQEEWLTGDNPVVPFPIEQLEVAPYKVDESFEESALIEVALLPNKGSGVRAQVFFLGLKKVGSGQQGPLGSRQLGAEGVGGGAAMSNLADSAEAAANGRATPFLPGSRPGFRRRHGARRCARRADAVEARDYWAGRLAAAEARPARACGRRLHHPPLLRRLRGRAARGADARSRAERAVPRLRRPRRGPAPRRPVDARREADGGRRDRGAALRPRLRLDARARRVPAAALRRAGLPRGGRRRDAALALPRDAARRDRRLLPRLGRHDGLADGRPDDGVPVPALRDHPGGDARDAPEPA